MLCRSTETNAKTGWYSKYHNHKWPWLCSRCYSKVRRRRLGIFQDFKSKLAKRVCSRCNSDETLLSYTKKGYPYQRWTKDGEGGWLCDRCYKKVVFTPERRRKWNERAMKFKDKMLFLKSNPRTGTCSRCGKTGMTHIHHIAYHDDDPLKDTIELCLSCHGIETWRLRKEKAVRF